MLNLEWFRTFKTIYETGGLSAAARSLFISQPGVSLHLNALESYIGHPLFARDSRKMTPTERGIILYNFIVDPLSKLTEAENIFHRNAETERPTISVGMTLETFESTLAEHMAQLPFNLIVRFGECAQMLQDLDTGALDLILTSHQSQQPNLEYTPFIKERLTLVCGVQTDTRELDQLTSENKKHEIKEWLSNQTWYTSAADMEHLRSFWLANFDCLPAFKPNYVVPHYGSILRCLRNGRGFAVVPDFVCREEFKCKRIKSAWEAGIRSGNTLLFGKRKKGARATEIQQLEQILTKSWLVS